MKIGAFAASYSVSIDAVRHYIDLGLLMPEKRGGQYSFDDRCGKDLEEINSLKSMGFTLAEIRTVFMFRKLGRMASNKQDKVIWQLFLNKHERVTELLEEIKLISQRLEDKIREFDGSRLAEPLKLGIQLQSLGLLKCSACRGDLNLRKARVEDNQIMDGMLECSCGATFSIIDGIVMRMPEAAVQTEKGGLVSVAGKTAGMTSNGTGVLEGGETVAANYTGNDAEIFDDDWISDYINNTDENYLKNVYKSLEWTYRRLKQEELDGKVLLELGCGIGFFLRHIYDELPESSVYIAVDHDIGILRYLKKMLENSGKRKNIVFICADFLELPVRDKAADIVLDLSGTSNYSFEHEEFLLRPMLRYFNEAAVLLGNYILFKNFSAKSMISVNFRKNFRLETIKKEISELGFEIINELITDYLDKGGKYESYFTAGEHVNGFAIHAKKVGYTRGLAF